jgi:hypothetical protein
VPPNPYRAGNLFFGRQHERDEVGAQLRDGHSVLLIGGRQAGKTTLLANLGDLERGLYIYDAGRWTLDTERDALEELGRGLGAPCSTRLEVEAAMRARQPLCVAIDEADRVLRATWGGAFFAWLRALDGPRGLGTGIAFLLAGGPVLLGYEDPDDRGSPVLNLALPVTLRPLDDAAIQAMVAHGGLAVAVADVMNLAGGHPWILRSLLADLADLADGRSVDDAAERLAENADGVFRVWYRQLGPDGQAFLRAFPRDGVPRSDFQGAGRSRRRTLMVRARFLCLLREAAGRYLPGPRLFFEWFDGVAQPERAEHWDLAISYASDDEAIARAVKQGLREQFRVFFAPDEVAWMWGEHLSRVLPQIYGVDARYVLVISTAHYVAKHWTLVEFEEARASGTMPLVVDLGALPPDLPADVVCWRGAPAHLVGLLDALRVRLGAP